MSSVGKIYVVCGILENTKTCLYGNKEADLFEANRMAVIFCYCPEMKNYSTLNKHPGIQ